MREMPEQFKAVRQAILRIAKANRAESLVLFGSHARGEASIESDVDFLATFAPGATLFDHARLEAELGELLGKRVDVVSSAVLKDDTFGTQVRQEAIAL